MVKPTVTATVTGLERNWAIGLDLMKPKEKVMVMRMVTLMDLMMAIVMGTH